MDYRYLNKQKTLTIGKYPTVTLVEARAVREKAKRLLSQNLNPGDQRKIERQQALQADADTFEGLVAEFLAKMVMLNRAQATIKKNRWMLTEVAKKLGKRPIRKITSPEVFGLLSDVEKSGRRDTAVATKAAISRVFRLAILSGRADADPNIRVARCT